MFSSIVSLSKRVFPPFSPGTPHAKRACGSSPTATSTLTALPADAFCRVLILAIEATEADYYVRSDDLVAIAAELTVELLGNLSLVSTSLRDACQDDHLWRVLCGRAQPALSLLPRVEGWKRLFCAHARAARHKLEAGDDDELLEDRVESTGLGGAPPLRVDRKDVCLVLELQAADDESEHALSTSRAPADHEASAAALDGQAERPRCAVSESGTLCFRASLACHDHEQCTCGRIVWEDLPLLSKLHCRHEESAPVVRCAALWDAKHQSLHYIASRTQTFVSVSTEETAAKGEGTEDECALSLAKCLDLAPALEYFSRHIHAYVQLDLTLDFAASSVALSLTRVVGGPNKHVPMNEMSVIRKRELEGILSMLDWA